MVFSMKENNNFANWKVIGKESLWVVEDTPQSL